MQFFAICDTIIFDYGCYPFIFISFFTVLLLTKKIDNEIDHVFFLPVDSDNITLDPDKNEIEEVKWIYVAELQKWLDKQPGKFTVWFPEAFKIVCDNIRLDGIGT